MDTRAEAVPAEPATADTTEVEEVADSPAASAAAKKTFDPKKHMMKIQGRDYLTVAWRLVWFRMEHPDWGIVTRPVEINLTPDNNRSPYAIYTATILNAEGRIMATATKMEDLRGFGDFLEKAEAGAVGRALAYCGYGTQFAPDLEEGRDRLADSPIAFGGGVGYGERSERSNGGYGGRAGSNGGGANRFASASGPAGGDGVSGSGGGPSRCSEEGCPNVLNAGQTVASMHKYGRPVCLSCQKLLGPAAAAVASAG